MFIIQIFLKKGNESVDNTKAKVGTIELIYGFGNSAKMKNNTITI